MKRLLILATLLVLPGCSIQIDETDRAHNAEDELGFSWPFELCDSDQDCPEECFCADGYCELRREAPPEAGANAPSEDNASTTDDASDTVPPTIDSDETSPTSEPSGNDSEPPTEDETADPPTDPAQTSSTDAGEDVTPPDQTTTPETQPDTGNDEDPVDDSAAVDPLDGTAEADAGVCAPTDGAVSCDNRPVVCFTNNDCGDGLCINGNCHDFCESSDECVGEQACVLGVCRDLDELECLTGQECTAGEDCVSGSCVRRCLGSVDCLECDDGPVCTNGYCGI